MRNFNFLKVHAMKPIFIMFTLFLAISMNAQINVYEPIEFSKESIFNQTNDTLSIKTLEMLGRTSNSSLNFKSALPSKYNWASDVRRTEAIERMTSEFRLQDSNGRDITPDMNLQNTSRLINRYMR